MTKTIRSLAMIFLGAVLIVGQAVAGSEVSSPDRAPFTVCDRAVALIEENRSRVDTVNVDSIIWLLRNGDTLTKRQAAYILGEWGDLCAVGDLILCLKESDTVLRRIAASALGKLGSSDAVQPLVRLAADESQPKMVRTVAVMALGRIADP